MNAPSDDLGRLFDEQLDWIEQVTAFDTIDDRPDHSAKRNKANASISLRKQKQMVPEIG